MEVAPNRRGKWFSEAFVDKLAPGRSFGNGESVAVGKKTRNSYRRERRKTEEAKSANAANAEPQSREGAKRSRLAEGQGLKEWRGIFMAGERRKVEGRRDRGAEPIKGIVGF